MVNNKAQANLLETIGGLFLLFLAINLIFTSPVTTNDLAGQFSGSQESKLYSSLSEISESDKFKEKFLNWNDFSNPSNDELVPIEQHFEKSFLYKVNYYCDGSKYEYIDEADNISPDLVYTNSFTLYDFDEYKGSPIDSTAFPCENEDSNSHYYNKVKVEVIIWNL